MVPSVLLLLLSFLAYPSLPAATSPSGVHCRVSVVLVGSTGDLAKRYLWPAIFNSFRQRECHSNSNYSQGCGLLVLGGARRVVGGEGVWHDLLSEIHCETVSCEICLQKFKNFSLLVKISDEEDYGQVSETLTDTYRRLNCTEVGRVFYLSVPPSAYVSIVRYIHAYTRPGGGAWLRVVLEKPFGNDLASAKFLSNELEQYLEEEEVYRVDHYLGKAGVQQILSFRQANGERLQRLWNKAHIQHVEVVVKERLDVEGRSDFFDKYGIIRDMHQNHLMEVLVRVLMGLARSGESFHELKMSFLAKLLPPTLQHSVLGQYDGYLAHLANGMSSSTPTYATVVLHSRDAKWTGVPLLLTAGKQLNERKAFARVVFKKWMFSLESDKMASCPAEIVFVIQDEELKQPGILLSSHFSGMGLDFDDWELRRVKMNQCSYLLVIPVQRAPSNAYIALVEDILNGERESFVDTNSLIASWQVWDPLLSEIQSTNGSLELVPYSPLNIAALNFSIENSNLKATAASSEAYSCKCGHQLISLSGIPVLKGSRQYIASCLAKDVYESASASVDETGVFHLALPGGRSPKLLFDSLSLEYADVFPWRRTHIWQTDERCVLPNDTKSNWNQIDDLLLSQVSAPYHQLHPMPTVLQNGVCMSGDGGCGLYERQLQAEIGSLTLSHVVLGVGKDGHIASLFPPHQLSSPVNSSQWVWLMRLHDTATVVVKERMTLSYNALLSAKVVSVLVMGEGKEEVVKRIMSGEKGSEMPVLKLLESSMGRERIKLYIAT